MKKGREFIFLVLGMGVISAAGFLTNLGLANQFGPEKFGEYSYVLLIGLLFGQLVVFGSDQYAVKLHLEDRQANISARVLIFRASNFVALCLIVAFWVKLTDEYLLVFSLIIASQVLNVSYAYEVEDRNVKYMAINLSERLLYYLTLWVGVIFFQENSFVFVFGVLLFWVVCSLTYQLSDVDIKLSNKLAPTTQMLGFGLGLVLFGLTKQMYGTGTRFFIEANLGFAALGLYSLAWQVVPLVSIYLEQAVKAWRGRVTKSLIDSDYKALKKALINIVMITTVPVLLGSLLLLLLGGAVVGLVLVPEYNSIIELLPWICSYLVMISIEVAISIIWVALGLIRILNLIYLVLGLGCFGFFYFFGEGLNLKGYLIAVNIFQGGAIVASIVVIFLFLVKKLEVN